MFVGNPWDLDVGNAHLNSTFMGKHVYNKAMGTNLTKIVEQYVAMVPVSVLWYDLIFAVLQACRDTLQESTDRYGGGEKG